MSSIVSRISWIFESSDETKHCSQAFPSEGNEVKDEPVDYMTERATQRDMSPAETIIAVMGMTGAGKSSFTQTVTGLDAQVGHNLASETRDICSYRLAHQGKAFVLVDTPGFDDSHRSNDDITKAIVDWLEQTFRMSQRLNGIIYVHSITNPRMQGSAFQSIRMFEKLCGDRALKNVVLATSFWDQFPDVAKAEEREKQLVTDQSLWANIIAKGARTARIWPDRGVCLKIIEGFAQQQAVDLLIQQETVLEMKELRDTLAGQVMLDPELRAVGEALEAERARERLQVEAELNAQQEASRRELERVKQEQARQAEADADRLKKEEERHRRILAEDAARREKQRLKVEAKQRRLEQERIQAEQKRQEAEARIREGLAEQERQRQQLEAAERARREENARLQAALQRENEARAAESLRQAQELARIEAEIYRQRAELQRQEQEREAEQERERQRDLQRRIETVREAERQRRLRYAPPPYCSYCGVFYLPYAYYCTCCGIPRH